MIDLTKLVKSRPCACGCGGSNGHVLSTDRQAERCTSIGLDDAGVIVRCGKPAGHSTLVPHGNGEKAWMG